MRRAVYQCAVSAARYNSLCKEMWLRMKEQNKPSKVALIAIANKLIRIQYALIQSDSHFNPNFLEVSLAFLMQFVSQTANSYRKATKHMRFINAHFTTSSNICVGILLICSAGYAICPNEIPKHIENVRNPKLLSTSEIRDGGSCYVKMADSGAEWLIYNNYGNTNIRICDKICDEKHSATLQWNSKAENNIENLLNRWKSQNGTIAKICRKLKWRNDIIRLISVQNVPDSNIIAAIRIHQINGYSKLGPTSDNRKYSYAVTKRTSKSYTVKITSADSLYYGYRTIETKFGSMVACKDMEKYGGKWNRNFYCWSMYSNK